MLNPKLKSGSQVLRIILITNYVFIICCMHHTLEQLLYFQGKNESCISKISCQNPIFDSQIFYSLIDILMLVLFRQGGGKCSCVCLPPSNEGKNILWGRAGFHTTMESAGTSGLHRNN